MSRIFWDAMLFVYLLEDNPIFSNRVRAIYERSLLRGDMLFTSCLAVAEVMAGPSAQRAAAMHDEIVEMGFRFLPFDQGAMAAFARVRSQDKVKIADAIHVACAASAGIDLFLTGDKHLHKLIVPGIQFIADFNHPIL